MNSPSVPTKGMHSDVVVIGGGLAGLTAAAYLAKAGRTVTLFEKSSGFGGRAATQEHNGYYFNRGIHALYCGGAGEQVLRELGVKFSGQSPKGSYVLRQGRLYAAPYDPLTLLRTSLLSLRDKAELIRLFSALPKMDAHALQSVSVQTWLEEHIQRPTVYQLMAATAKTFVYSAALDLVSAEVLVQKLQTTLKHPVLYLDGGWQTLVDGLRRIAEQAGAQIVSGTRVEAVEQVAGQVQGVRLRDGSVVHAPAVVVATTPQDAVKLIQGGEYASLRQIVDTLVPAQVACLDVALRQLPAPHHPIVQDLDHPIFMSTQSLWSKVAPDGGALVYAFKQLDPRQPSDPHQDEQELENLLDTVQPGWREQLVKRFFLPRIEAIGTLPTVANGGFAGRPGLEVPGISGLYLAGDWIGAEGFLSDASMASARQVAQLVLTGEYKSTPTGVTLTCRSAVHTDWPVEMAAATAVRPILSITR